MELTKEQQFEFLKKIANNFQPPIQYQFMAMEQLLLFQKRQMEQQGIKELFIPYIESLKICFDEQFENLLKEGSDVESN